MNPRVRSNYTQKNLMKALKSIEVGKYKICEAARIFKIPRQTLADKIRGRRPYGYCKPGPPAVLGEDLEAKIEKWLLENSRLGFESNKESLLFSVQHTVDLIPENIRGSIPFKNNTPGRGWFNSFRKRHPQIAAEYRDLNKKKIFSGDDVTSSEHWYKFVREILNSENCLELLNDPNRIFAMNEFKVNFDEDSRVISLIKKKSNKLPSAYYNENTFSISLISNARGKLAPIVISTTNIENLNQMLSTSNSDHKWTTVLSESRNMTCKMFYEFVTELFYPYLVSFNVTFPIVVFVDGNISCTSLPLSEFCKNNIIFIAIPKSFAKSLNPLDTLDKFPFELFKEKSESFCHDHSEIHPIVSFIDNLLKSTVVEQYIIERFVSCNLFPFYNNDDSTNSFGEIIRPCIVNEKHSTVLDYFESKIPSNILQLFRKCKLTGSSWNGDKEYKGLFNFWLDASEELEFTSKRDNIEHVQPSSPDNLDIEVYIIEEVIESD